MTVIDSEMGAHLQPAQSTYQENPHDKKVVDNLLKDLEVKIKSGAYNRMFKSHQLHKKAFKKNVRGIKAKLDEEIKMPSKK